MINGEAAVADSLFIKLHLTGQHFDLSSCQMIPFFVLHIHIISRRSAAINSLPQA
jgi:hypothetical protein